jgi:hypothetical protein
MEVHISFELDTLHRIDHSIFPSARYLENLAAGTGDYTIQAAVQDWENEACKSFLIVLKVGIYLSKKKITQRNIILTIPNRLISLKWFGKRQLSLAAR